MRELEQLYPDEIIVIGVHSGKYLAERVTSRIAEAAQRLGVHHPVLNDRQFRVWRSYAVNAWPTLVAIDAAGYVVGMHAGEFTAEMLREFLDAQIARAQEAGNLDRTPRSWDMDPPAMAPGLLRYPGKVAVDGSRIAIADSGNDRVIVAELETEGMRARVTRIADGPNDRTGEEALPFRNPQGVLFAGDRLFVADAGNHLVRVIDLGSGEVSTVAGTGRQMRTRADLRAGALSSPWDLALDGEILYVAMAGVHRLWAVNIRTGQSWPFSGSGREDIIDGPHPDSALAQPMGLALGDGRLYFADAESSAVRVASTDPKGDVTTLVGTGLFDFGDRDGAGDVVRLEHAQDVAAHEDGRLLVCDSYNDALKWLDPATREVTTWVRGLHEPAGLAMGAGRVYVADTNAHRIAVVDMATGRVDTLEFTGL